MIELGEIRPPVETWSPVRRSRRRPWWRLALAVVVALALTGPSAVARHDYLGDPTTIPVFGAVSVLIDGDNAYVADDDRGRNRLQAYDLRSGRRRWTHATGFYSGDLHLALAEGVLLVTALSSSGVGIEAYDARVGTALWTNGSSLIAVTDAEQLILIDLNPAGGWTITEADPRHGTPAWSLEADNSCGFAFDGPFSLGENVARGVTNLIRTCRVDDPTSVFDLDVTELSTGRGLASTTLPAPGSTFWPAVMVVDGVVLVKDNSRGDRPTVALRLSDLTRAWTGPDVDGDHFINLCDGRICYYDGQTTSILDPATGRPTGPPDAVPLTGNSGYFLIAAVGDNEGDIPSMSDTFRTSVAAPGPTWLAVGPRIVQSLPDVGSGACQISGGALVCSVGDNVNVVTNRLLVWRLPRR